MPTSSSISPTIMTSTGPNSLRGNPWTDIYRDDPPLSPTRRSLCSRFWTTVDSLIDRYRPSPSVYSPSRRRRTYRRAKGKIKRFGTWCKEHITPSKIPRTISIDRSHGLGPDGRPNTNLFGSQLATPNTSSLELTREFSFKKVPQLAPAPVLDFKGGALRYGPNSISGHGHGKKDRLVRHPTALSGTTARSDPEPPPRYYARPNMRRLTPNALSDTRSVNSVDHKHHCEDVDGCMSAENEDLKNGPDTEDPVSTVVSQGDKGSVSCRESEDHKESVGSKKSVDYGTSVDDKDTNGMEGLPSIPPFDFDADFDFGFVKLDVGSEKSGSWLSQPESIVV